MITDSLPSGGVGGGGSEPEVILEFTNATKDSVVANYTTVEGFYNLVKDYTWVYFISWVDGTSNKYISGAPAINTNNDYIHNAPLYVPMFKTWKDFYSTHSDYDTNYNQALLDITSYGNSRYYAPTIEVKLTRSNGQMQITWDSNNNSWESNGSKNRYILYGIK